jgi:hypothetical protein
MANAQVALWAAREGNRLMVDIHSTRAQQASLVLMQGDVEISRQALAMTPSESLHLALDLSGNLTGETRVLILRPTGEAIIEQTVAPPGG